MILRPLVSAAVRSADFRVLATASAMLVVIGATFFHFVEGLRWLDAVWFSVITLTTVGYGDFSPQTDAGKVFTMLWLLLGLGVLAGFIGVVADLATQVARERKG